MNDDQIDFKRGLDACEEGDYLAALSVWLPLAERGHASVQLNLGIMHSKGLGVPQNDLEAVKWFRLAAEQGDSIAQFNLGVMHASGRGVQKNHSEAVKWYQKSAIQGYAPAQFNLSNCYSSGLGVPKSEAEAVKWLREAADQDICRAQFLLACSYDDGEGVPQDYVQAYMWYSAAEKMFDSETKWPLKLLTEKMSPHQIQQAKAMTEEWIKKHRDPLKQKQPSKLEFFLMRP